MTREEAIFVLERVEAHGLVDDAKRMAIEALKAEPSKDSPDNVFVLRVNMFASDGIINGLREMVIDQIRSGVVVLPAYTELLTVTGPCTDVEVRIITEEDKQT